MWSSWWEMMVSSDYSGTEDVVRSLSNWTCWWVKSRMWKKIVLWVTVGIWTWGTHRISLLLTYREAPEETFGGKDKSKASKAVTQLPCSSSEHGGFPAVATQEESRGGAHAFWGWSEAWNSFCMSLCVKLRELKCTYCRARWNLRVCLTDTSTAQRESWSSSLGPLTFLEVTPTLTFEGFPKDCSGSRTRSRDLKNVCIMDFSDPFGGLSQKRITSISSFVREDSACHSQETMPSNLIKRIYYIHLRKC